MLIIVLFLEDRPESLAAIYLMRLLEWGVLFILCLILWKKKANGNDSNETFVVDMTTVKSKDISSAELTAEKRTSCWSC
jgi:hypothetical protein